MKYRVLIPPVLVVLFVISIFSTMKNNTATEKQYEDYINQARDSAGYEIYVDAEADYNAALGMKKSVDRLAEANVKNVSLTDLDTVAQVAAAEGYIRPEDQQRLLKFRENPSDESWIQK